MSSSTTPAEAPDAAVLRAEWRLRLLEEMAEVCMDLGRIVHRQAKAAAEPAEPIAIEAAKAPATRAGPASPSEPDPSEAIARISRALRLTLALHGRTDDALRALRAGVVAEREARRVEAGRRAADEAAAQVRAAVTWSSAWCSRRPSGRSRTRRPWTASSWPSWRAWTKTRPIGTGRMPVRETVEHLCADLELTPDWSLWEGEGWTPQAPFHRPRSSIWARPSRRPLRPFDDGAVQSGGCLAHRRE